MNTDRDSVLEKIEQAARCLESGQSALRNLCLEHPADLVEDATKILGAANSLATEEIADAVAILGQIIERGRAQAAASAPSPASAEVCQRPGGGEG